MGEQNKRTTMIYQGCNQHSARGNLVADDYPSDSPSDSHGSHFDSSEVATTAGGYQEAAAHSTAVGVLGQGAVQPRPAGSFADACPATDHSSTG